MQRHICFSGYQTAILRFNKYISISSGLLLCSFKMSYFFALKYNPITGLTDISDLKRKGLPLKFCTCRLCQSLLSEVLLRLLFSSLKRQNCKFPDDGTKTGWKLLSGTQKLPFGLLENIFSYIDK